MTGILMSMSTTSGRVAAHDGDPLAAVGGLAHDFEVGLRVDQHADAGAEERLVVDERDADRTHAGTPVGRTPATTNVAVGIAGAEPSADEARALAHADHPVPGLARPVTGLRRVAHLELDARLSLPDRGQPGQTHRDRRRRRRDGGRS